MSIDTITQTDMVVLDLVRGRVATTDLHPRDPRIAEIRAEAERHMPGSFLRVDYGIFGGVRGTQLYMLPDQITVQDTAYDAIEGYFGARP